MIPDIKKSKKRNARTNKKRSHTRKRRGTNKTSRKRGGASDADVSDYINIHQPGLNDREGGVKVKVYLKEGVKEGGKTGVFEGSLMSTRPLKEGGILFTIKPEPVRVARAALAVPVQLWTLVAELWSI